MSFLGKERWGVSGLGSSACKIPNRFPSESAFEFHLPRQTPYYYELRRQLEAAELALAVPALAADRPYSFSGYGDASADRPYSFSGYGGAPVDRPYSFSGYGGAPADRPYFLSGYGGGPNRSVVKVPGSTPGKIPIPSSDLGKMKKSVVRYEADASDPTAVWRVVHLRPSEEPRKLPDRVPPAEWENEKTRRSGDLRWISLNSTQGTRLRNTSEGNFNSPPTGFSVVANGRGEDQLPHVFVASPTLNNLNPSHGPELARQCSQYPRKSAEIRDYQLENGTVVSKSEEVTDGIDCAVQGDFGIPSWLFGLSLPDAVEHAKDALSVMDKNVDSNEVGEIQKDESALKGSDAKTKSNDPMEAPSQPVDTNDKAEAKKGVNESGDEDKINKDVAVKTNFVMANVPDEAKLYLAQLYMVGRGDKLRSTGLFWELPPWPDFCTMNCDRVAQHCEYEVIEKFYSVKLYNHGFLYYIDRFEELIKIWPIMNEDYYARVEGREIISNLSKVTGLATMSATMRLGLDNIDEYVRNTIAWAFSVLASALDTSALLSFWKIVCQSKKSWQVWHTDVKVVQPTAILMGCTDLPHLKSLVEIFEHGRGDENPKVQTITALVEAVASYGRESFNTVWKPPWKGIRSHLGKVFAAYLINEKLSIDEIKLTPLKPFELIASIKSELMKMRHEVEEERMRLQMARVWRVERVQRKLVVAKLTIDSKYALLNKLQSDLEEFLSFHRGNSVDEEIHKSAEESGDSLIAKKCLGMPKAMRSHHEYNYVDYRKGIGVVCNKKGGFGVDDRWLWSTGLLWTLPPWPDLSLCEADWMALDIKKGAAAMYLRRAAMFGGIVGQEVVQACSGKFHPVYQFFYIDSVESLSVEPLEYGDLKPESTIYAVQISISGSKLQKELEQAKVFMGGSGALGCEFLKNLALMGSVTARMYIDSRCVYFQKPLPESGFLGAKCNTQMTKPHLTENHGASRDPPEKQAPMCTVHSFLHNIDHCLTWARSEFEGLLEKTPIEVNAFLPNPTGYAIASRTARDQLKCVIECLHGEKCETFQDCITWTRLKFEDYLLSRVKQLMFTFPEDSMTNSGTPSWSAPRRSPRPLEFTPTELSQLNLVLTASILRAETFVIPIPYWAFTFSSFTKLFASKLGVDDINATAIRNCDLEGSFMLNISKMISVPDRGRFFAFGSVFSREVAAGKRDLYAKNVQSSDIWKGKKQGSVENVFCGNTFVMVGLDQLTTKNATLTNESEVDVCLIRTMTFSVFPVVLFAAQCRIASDFPKLIEGLKLLAKFDSTVLCTMEESGENIITEAGELHLGNCLKDLLKKFLWRMLILLRNIPRIVCPYYHPGLLKTWNLAKLLHELSVWGKMYWENHSRRISLRFNSGFLFTDY